LGISGGDKIPIPNSNKKAGEPIITDFPAFFLFGDLKALSPITSLFLRG